MPEALARQTTPERLAGWIGLDAPLELIEAAGFTPWRLSVDPRGASPPSAWPLGEGGGHPWMRAMLAELLQSPRLERLVLCAMPANELWLYNLLLSLRLRGEGEDLPDADLCNLSHERRPSSDQLNHNSLHAVGQALGGVDRDALTAAITERNRLRAVLRSIDARRHGGGARMSGREARRRMDIADRMRSSEAMEALATAVDPAPAQGLATILSSPVTPNLELYAALEARGLHIVGEDADAGSRSIGPDTDEGCDPWEALARRYAARAPAPAGWTIAQRAAYLLDLTLSRGAKAVVFDLPEWNHPSGWDYPSLREALEAHGVLCVHLPHAPADPAAANVADQLRAPITECAHV